MTYRNNIRKTLQILWRLLFISDLVNRDISTAMGRASLYDWIVYKRESKARERKGEEEQRRSK